MNNLLFYTLLALLVWYFFYYLPNQKPTSTTFSPAPSTPLFSKSTQTEITTSPEPDPKTSPDPNLIQKLEDEVSAKQTEISVLKKDQAQKEQTKLTNKLEKVKDLVLEQRWNSLKQMVKEGRI